MTEEAKWLLVQPYTCVELLTFFGWVLEMRHPFSRRIVASNSKSTVASERKKGTPSFSREGLVSLCRGCELDRVWTADMPRLLKIARSDDPSWAAIVDGADGLKPEDARAAMTFESVFRRMGIELVDVKVIEERKQTREVA